MPQLLDLSVELILCNAANVRQVDLLNISLTCKTLREVTIPELFRKYRNPNHYGPPLSRFAHVIVRHPELAKYLQRVDIKGWTALDDLDPMVEENPGSEPKSREEKIVDLEDWLRGRTEPSKKEYDLCIRAAKASGIIVDIYPYEHESRVMEQARPMLSRDDAATYPNFSHTYLFDAHIRMEHLPLDRRFCQLLRAGSDDAYAMLLFALLPNVNTIILPEAQSHIALEWPAPNHQF
jgi:hypothetical protein